METYDHVSRISPTQGSVPACLPAQQPLICLPVPAYHHTSTWMDAQPEKGKSILQTRWGQGGNFFLQLGVQFRSYKAAILSCQVRLPMCGQHGNSSARLTQCKIGVELGEFSFFFPAFSFFSTKSLFPQDPLVFPPSQ